MLKKLPEISKAELDLLKILWEQSPLSIREVHNNIPKEHAWAYSTTKTMMDRMLKKEYLLRENFHGVYIYKPLISKPAGLAKFVNFFAKKVLETEVGSVVNMFTGGHSLTKSEVKELELLLKQLEEGEQND